VEWVVTSARTIEEATEMALDQLGVDEQDAEIEVVQDAQKGLFGRLRAEAQVRARVRPTSPRPKVDRRDRRRGDRRGREGDRGRARKSAGGGRERVAAGVGTSGGGSSTDAERPGPGAAGDDDTSSGTAGSRRPGSGGGDAAGGNRRRRRNRPSSSAEGAAVSDNTQSSGDSRTETMDLEAQQAAVEGFLTDLLAAFGRPDATIAVAVGEDEALEASVDGSELGLLVGQKGVTLAAVQELVRSMVQRQFVGQPHARVRVDVAGYRARRKEALARFATSIAESVKESGVAKALDPMGSADRKVVHDTVNEIEGVVTVSEGEDAARRVVIRPA
jgi:spoIIIJ-associated protein